MLSPFSVFSLSSLSGCMVEWLHGGCANFALRDVRCAMSGARRVHVMSGARRVVIGTPVSVA